MPGGAVFLMSLPLAWAASQWSINYVGVIFQKHTEIPTDLRLSVRAVVVSMWTYCLYLRPLSWNIVRGDYVPELSQARSKDALVVHSLIFCSFLMESIWYKILSICRSWDWDMSCKSSWVLKSHIRKISKTRGNRHTELVYVSYDHGTGRKYFHCSIAGRLVHLAWIRIEPGWCLSSISVGRNKDAHFERFAMDTCTWPRF